MGETNTTEPERPTFAEIIVPLARRHNELVDEGRQLVGEKREGLDREKSEAYNQMVHETSRAILKAAKGKRKPIIDTAIDAFTGSTSKLNVSQYSIQTFIVSVLLKTVELAESQSQQNPQK